MGLKIIEARHINIDNKINNEYFENIVDTSSVWIESRTGIKSRFFTDKRAYDMAIETVKLFKNSLRNLDLIIVASFTTRMRAPSVAASINEFIGGDKNILCFDLNMACSGFMGAMILAEKYLEIGGKALIIATEKISDFLNFKDRSSCVLFGDGAAGALVEKNNKLWEHIVGTFPGIEALNVNENSLIEMDGKKVYRFASVNVAIAIEDLLKKYKIMPQEIDYYLLHQANIRIINQVLEKLKIKSNKTMTNIDRYGNTSAASIPILISENFHKFKEQDKIVIAGFGAGLSIAAVLMEW